MEQEAKAKLIKYSKYSSIVLAGFLGFSYLWNNIGKVREERILTTSQVGNATLVYTQEDRKWALDNYALKVIDDKLKVITNSIYISKNESEKALRQNDLVRKLEQIKK
jgi:hypothetical protein